MTSAATAPASDLHTTPTRSADEARELFRAVEQKFSNASLGDDRWWLVVVPPLIYTHPHHVATLYTHLISRPPLSTSRSARQSLMRRLRECLLESVPILGVVRVLEALMAIVAVEDVGDRETSYSRGGYVRDDAHRERGDKWLERLYGRDLPRIDALFEGHKDFLFVNHEISYGLYLSDMQILGEVETELLVLSGILVQRAMSPSSWHLKGMRRIGVASDDIEQVQCCIEMVAAFGGLDLSTMPRVADIEHEV